MSAGSFDYLYTKGGYDLMTNCGSGLNEMAEALSGVGYAGDAAKETRELLDLISRLEARLNSSANDLRDVWKAMERWHSGDSAEDDLKDALEKWRAKIQRN